MDVVPNAVPVDFANRGTKDYFLLIGRLSREKGVEIAAEAARRSGVRLIVAGDGPLKDSLEAHYPEFLFTGHLGGNEVHSLRSGHVPLSCRPYVMRMPPCQYWSPWLSEYR